MVEEFILLELGQECRRKEVSASSTQHKYKDCQMRKLLILRLKTITLAPQASRSIKTAEKMWENWIEMINKMRNTKGEEGGKNRQMRAFKTRRSFYQFFTALTMLACKDANDFNASSFYATRRIKCSPRITHLNVKNCEN
jgi:hypothetical protein